MYKKGVRVCTKGKKNQNNNLTINQCECNMQPILQYGLPALGACRNFLRDVVFAHHKHIDLGFKHSHTIQEIEQLKDMLNNTFYILETKTLLFEG